MVLVSINAGNPHVNDPRRNLMTLPRTVVVPGLLSELEAFGALIAPMDAASWATPTRCEGWAVGDVAGHVIGSIADVVSGQLEGLGSPEATAREVAERKGRSPAELAQECAGVTKQAADLAAVFDDAAWETPAPGSYDGTLGQGVEALWYDTYLHADDIRAALGQGVEALWYDTYLHADDIRAALGQPSQRGEGLRAGVHHVAAELDKRGWGPATLAFEGIEAVPVGRGGEKHTGDALQFILVATGRTDPKSLGTDGPINIYA
jgi:hypothetical protein